MTTADETRQRLLDAAGPLFAEQGLKATTVRVICDRADMNLAAINYHFRDKKQLYHEAVRHAAHCCDARVPIPDWPAGTPPERKLRDFVAMFLNRVAVDHEPAWHAQLLMRELTHPTPACAEFVRDFVRPCFEALSGVLRELLPDVPELKRRLVAFSIVGQCLHYRVARPVIEHLVGAGEFRNYGVDLLAGHITEFSLAAIDRLAARSHRKGPS
ncbi:MAG: CerR family C-terminal domain-containing protein [Planctomycetes bacterium]|nr:CerR family C-terminal domain-containing protein [Planctomycetota bacterium]